jgi:hypothetical protein
MKIKKQKVIYFFLLAAYILCLSCDDDDTFTSPKGYNLNEPVKVSLESQLDEISGIFYYPKDTGIFAISDATGSLYKIFPDKNGMVQKWKFGKNNDFEDLQLYDSVFYVLASNGNIVSIRFITADSLQTNEFAFPKEKAEFESLYFDTSLKKLILICKSCKEDKKKEVSTYAFDPANQTYSDGPFKLDADKIAAMLHEDKVKFKCSAAAINPLTDQLFIISSVNKALVVADKNGNILQVHKLDPSIYKQPEGINFTPAGDLLISNESAKEGNANILVVKYKKQRA